MLSMKKCSRRRREGADFILQQKLALRDVNSFASSTVLKQGFNGDGTVVSYLNNVRRAIMKLRQWH
jgi:hypothetical protein